jgi:hypothetical protein
MGFLDAAAQLRITVVGADISVRDWAGDNERDLIFDLAVQGYQGKVLLFHDGSGDVYASAIALRWVLEHAKRQQVSAISLDRWRRLASLPMPNVRYEDLAA